MNRQKVIVRFEHAGDFIAQLVREGLTFGAEEDDKGNMIIYLTGGY